MVARYQAGLFGLLLQRHRIAAGLSQEELAERAGLSRRGLSDLERGARRTPYPATVRRLAEALGLAEADRAALLMAAHTRHGSIAGSDAQPRAGHLPALADTLDLTSVDRVSLEDVVTERANATATAGEPLVGREKEFDRILSIMDTVTVGSGRLVFVTGEPGIGKRRLARNVLSHARRAGAQGLVGRCFQQQMTVPFFPFTEALTTALGCGPRGWRVDLRDRWPELAHLVPELGDLTRPDQGNMQLRIFRAVDRFLHALADTAPLVLLLEDLQWADSTSLDLLLFLGRHLDNTRMLILGTYRDADVGRQQPLDVTVRELVRERLVEEVHLRRLAAGGTAALVRAWLGVETASDELVTLVHGRAEGNPFFIEELLKAFVEKEALGTIEGGVGLIGGNDLEVPHSIRSVVDERIGRLPRQSQELLRLAALVGQEFDLDVLLGASGRAEAEILDGLDAALDARIIEHHHSGRERFGFVHALFQQALYDELPVYRRRRMHIQVGEALLRLPARTAAVTSDLARHFLLGGDATRAASCAIDAGDHAASHYAHAEAVHHYQVAVGLLLDDVSDPARIADVQYRLADELYDLNRLPDALAAYEAALHGYQHLSDAQGQALAEWGIARLHQGRYDMVSARLHVEEALRLWPEHRQDAEYVRLLVDAARINTFGGVAANAVELAERSQVLAERIGGAGLVARALSGLSLVRMQVVPRVAEIGPILDRAVDLAQQASDWRTLSRVYLSRATISWLIGDLDGGIRDRRHAVEAAERSGESERLALAYDTLGMNLMQVGAWEEGRAAIRAALALDPEQRYLGKYGSVFLAWMEGRHAEALRDSHTYITGARQRFNFQGVTFALCWHANLMLQLGRAVEAEAAAREALSVAHGSWRSGVGLAAAALAEAAARLGAEDAAATLAEAQQLIDEFGTRLALPQLLRARATGLARQHAFSEAIEILHTSAATARSQHAVIDLAQTLALLGSLARQCGEDALTVEADAERLEIIKRIGSEVSGLDWAPSPLSP